MAKQENLKRFNIRMGQEIYDVYEEQAGRLGIPVSSLMIMAMNEYMKGQQAINQLRELSPHVDVIREGIQRAINKA